MIRRCNLTQINPKHMPKSKTNFVNCNKTIDALNKILFQQQLIKCNKQLSNKMLQELQEADPKYASLKSKLISGLEDKNFKLVNKILYKTEMVFDQLSYKLCLPSFVAMDILNRQKKVVRFEKATVFTYQVNNVSLNYTRIQQSVAASCSLLETNLFYKLNINHLLSIFKETFNLSDINH